MQQRALVIRAYGNQELAKSMAAAMESSELQRLRAKLEMREPREQKYYRQKIQAANRKYKIKPMSPLKKKFWETVGLIMVLAGVA